MYYSKLKFYKTAPEGILITFARDIFPNFHGLIWARSPVQYIWKSKEGIFRNQKKDT